MPHAVRDATGSIISLHRSPVSGSSPLLPTDAPELERFLGEMTPSNFDQLDAEFVRVLEDLIEALDRRGLIALGDLPPSAVAKLYRRQAMRERPPARAPAAPASVAGFADSGFVEVVDDSRFGELGALDLGFAGPKDQPPRRSGGR